MFLWFDFKMDQKERNAKARNQSFDPIPKTARRFIKEPNLSPDSASAKLSFNSRPEHDRFQSALIEWTFHFQSAVHSSTRSSISTYQKRLPIYTARVRSGRT